METNGNGKTPPGLQAYRWLVMAGIAILGVLSMRVLERIDKTADAVAGIVARTEAHGEKLTTHDRKIERLEDKVFRPSAAPK
jgi:hypothetical protein